MAVVYITGGARSGKSTLAEALARPYGQVLYIATARPCDEEMAERIRVHRARRPAHWDTFEGVRGLAEAIRGREGCVLLDCVTNLLTNLMLDMQADWEHPTPQSVEEAQRLALGELEALADGARAQDNQLLLVSNELGMGLVPPYPFGRVFRDVAGRVNQRLAQLADEAYLCVSGIPLRLK